MTDRAAATLAEVVVAPARPGAALAPLTRPLAASPLLLACFGWAALIAVGLIARPLLPIDETRCLGVAWEMRVSGDWLVPRLNGEPYAHKGPLLYWLINAAWSLFGVSELVARLVAPLCALACLPLCAWLGRELWPERDEPARWAPLALAGAACWALLETLTFFDGIVAAGALLAACGAAMARRGRARGWALVPLGIAIGMLAKGPVALVHIAPLVLLAPWWGAGADRAPWSARARLTWTASALGAILAGLALVLAWAVPAARAGGDAYAGAILVDQTVDRLAGAAYAHPRPWWWYLPMLPALLLPWSVFPAWWRAAASAPTRARLAREPGVRACLAWIVSAFALLSCSGGKLPHYLLPLLPPAALLAARLLPECRPRGRRDQAPLALILVLAGVVAALLPLSGAGPAWLALVTPWAGVAVAGFGLALLAARLTDATAWLLAAMLAVAGSIATLELGARPAMRAAFDLSPVAARIAELRARAVPISYIGLYHGEFSWLARLREPLPSISLEAAQRWLVDHPGEALVATYRPVGDAMPGDPDWSRPYRDRHIGLWLGARARAGGPPLAGGHE